MLLEISSIQVRPISVVALVTRLFGVRRRTGPRMPGSGVFTVPQHFGDAVTSFIYLDNQWSTSLSDHQSCLLCDRLGRLVLR